MTTRSWPISNAHFLSTENRPFYININLEYGQSCIKHLRLPPFHFLFNLSSSNILTSISSLYDCVVISSSAPLNLRRLSRLRWENLLIFLWNSAYFIATRRSLLFSFFVHFLVAATVPFWRTYIIIEQSSLIRYGVPIYIPYIGL